MVEQVVSFDVSGEFFWCNIDYLCVGGWLSFVVLLFCGGVGVSLVQLQQVIVVIVWGELVIVLIVCMQYFYYLWLVENDVWYVLLCQQVFYDVVEYGGFINSLCVELELGFLVWGGLLDIVVICCVEGWDISGYKIYIIGIEGLCWLVVWVRSDDNLLLVGIWLVSGDSLGISVVKSWDYVGMWVIGSYEVIFNYVWVVVEYVVDVWLIDVLFVVQVELFCLFVNWQMVLLVVIYDSIVYVVYDWLVRWLVGWVFVGFGYLFFCLLWVQEKVGQIVGLLLVNCSLLEQVVVLCFFVIEVNLVKVIIIDNVIQVVNIVFELIGNYGFS